VKVDSARPYVVDSLHYALNPRSIAVVGASRYPLKVGYKFIENLQSWGYPGRIFPVNPRAKSVRGLPAYPTVADIPEEVDLAFVAVPAYLLKMVIEQCVAKQVKAVAVASSGLKEIGRSTLQDELTTYCRDHQLVLLGPNLLGMGSPHSQFACGFIPYPPLAGPVALISQSGANLLAGLGASRKDGLGLSFFVGLGNKADVDFCEFIAYAGRDQHTRSVAIYAEGLDSEPAFIEACRQVAPSKPIVVIKTGGSKIGRKAAFAHTASDAGPSDAHYDEVCRQAGALRATSWQEFLDVALALGLMPPLSGDRVVMITNGGGSGLLAGDDFERRGMPLHELDEISPELKERIKAYMPMFGSPLNPVDISGTAGELQYGGALLQTLRDPNVDAALVSVCPTAVTDVPAIVAAILDVHQRCRDLNKPIIAELQGGPECNQAIVELRAAGVPAYLTPEGAVTGMIALHRYAGILAELGTGNPR
jgi:acetate---CoA ligase (ADP-forming) subunit alpha